MGGLTVCGCVWRDQLHGIVRIALSHQDHLVRVVAQLGFGFITAFFSNTHQHGKLRLKVHIVEHLLWLMVRSAVLMLLLLRRFVQLLTVILLVYSRSGVVLLACRAASILDRLDVLAGLVTVVVLGI